MTEEMEVRQLPRVLLLRVQNKLRRVVKEAYPTGINNVVKVVLEDESIIYFNLSTGQEVNALEVLGKQDTLKLTGGKQAEEPPLPKGVFDKVISRSDTPEDPPLADLQTEETAKKKSSTKKATTKKVARSKSTK